MLNPPGREGRIESLNTGTGNKITADLYIDCTGFRSLLLDKTLAEPFESYSRSLFVDRAIALRVPYDDPESEMHPYTSSTALSSGWVWNIPVADRIGTGYVYSSAFSSDDDAENELRVHLGKDRVKDISANRLNIGRVGKHRNTWVGNCVGIGLSSGFLEPIESTSLHFVYAGVAKLAEALGDGYYNAATISAYNMFITDMMEEARDFIVAHYALTQREDSAFWAAVKYDTVVPESLGRVLSRARLALPEADSEQIIFKYSSWACILAGMNFFPNPAGYANMQQQDVIQHYRLMNEMKKLGARLSGEATSHYQYISGLNTG